MSALSIVPRNVTDFLSLDFSSGVHSVPGGGSPSPPRLLLSLRVEASDALLAVSSCREALPSNQWESHFPIPALLTMVRGWQSYTLARCDMMEESTDLVHAKIIHCPEIIYVHDHRPSFHEFFVHIFRPTTVHSSQTLRKEKQVRTSSQSLHIRE
jgi:hypothetical protein